MTTFEANFKISSLLIMATQDESKENIDSCSQSQSDWLITIQQQLHARDLREKIPFQNISLSYDLLLDENVDLSKRVSDLSQAVLQLKQDNWNKPSLFINTSPNNGDNDNTNSQSNKDNDSNNNNSSKKSKKSKKNKNNNDNTNNTSSSPTNYEVESIKNENESLRKELMDVYRLKKENEEALSRLKKQSIENEELIIQQTKSINELSIKHQDLLIQHSDLKEGKWPNI